LVTSQGKIFPGNFTPIATDLQLKYCTSARFLKMTAFLEEEVVHGDKKGRVNFTLPRSLKIE